MRVVSISGVGDDKCINPKSKTHDMVISRIMVGNQPLIILCELGCVLNPEGWRQP